MPPTRASAKIASASASAQVQKVSQKRPTGNTVVHASAARAAARSATSARDDSFVDPRERKALALLQGLAAAIGRIAEADPAVAAAVQLPKGVTLLDVAVAVDAAVARVERPDSPCYSPNSPEAPPSPDYAPSSPNYYYYPSAADPRPPSHPGSPRYSPNAPKAPASPRYAPSPPDVR